MNSAHSDLDPAVPLLPCDVRERKSAKQVLVTLVEHVLSSLDSAAGSSVAAAGSSVASAAPAGRDW